MDKPIKDLFKKEIPELEEVEAKVKAKLPIKREIVDFEAKYDGASKIGGRCIFYKVKGAGDNTNDVLSAITAAQLIKENPKYKKFSNILFGIQVRKTLEDCKEKFFLKKRK